MSGNPCDTAVSSRVELIDVMWRVRSVEETQLRTGRHAQYRSLDKCVCNESDDTSCIERGVPPKHRPGPICTSSWKLMAQALIKSAASPTTREVGFII